MLNKHALVVIVKYFSSLLLSGFPQNKNSHICRFKVCWTRLVLHLNRNDVRVHFSEAAKSPFLFIASKKFDVVVEHGCGRRERSVRSTVSACFEDEALALRAGFNAHLAKPVDAATLLSVIAAMTKTR